MPVIRNTIIHNALAVEPTAATTESSLSSLTNEGEAPHLIKLVLLLIVLLVMIGAILFLSLCGNITATSATAHQQPQPTDEEGNAGSNSKDQRRRRQQQKLYKVLRNGLHGMILLMALVMSVVAHFSCTMVGLEEPPSDVLQAIGIWKVWHAKYQVCLDPSLVGFSSSNTSGSTTRTLAVLATLLGATSLLLLLLCNSTTQKGPGRGVKVIMTILSAVCGFTAAILQGSALATLRRDSDACDDYGCSSNLDASGAMWPILAIVYWIAGGIVTLSFMILVPVVVTPISDDGNDGNNDDNKCKLSSTLVAPTTTTTQATNNDQTAGNTAEMDDRTNGSGGGDCRRRSILSPSIGEAWK